MGWHDARDILLGEGPEDGSLTSVVETEDKDSGLTRLFLEHAKLAEKSHFCLIFSLI